LADLGLEMELVCLNHWPTAIETHSLNHPKARHYCQDISTVRPHICVPEGYLDLLMASPTCTHHSVARGGKPTSDQQRSDPWHIIPWFTELRVKRAIIENVWEYISWGPVDVRTGKPIKSRKGEYFRAWVDTIWKLGATSVEYRKLNSANYGEATTRQRFIMKIRFDRVALGWAPLTHQKREEGKLELFPTLKPWRPAREIIDWSIKGKSIFGRKKPLAPKTLARIYAGAIKFKWPEPFVRLLEAEIEHSLRYMINWAFKLRNQPKKKEDRRRRRALVRDLISRLRHFRIEPSSFGRGGRTPEPMLVTLRRNADGRSVDQPVPALAANGTHIGVAEPVIINGRKGNKAKPVSTEPVPTLDTKGGVWLAEPLILSQHNSGAARSTDDPLPTITTGGAGSVEHPGCARPMLVTIAHGNDPQEKDANSRRTHDIEEPLGTVHGTGSPYAVVEPFILNRHGDNGGTRAHSPDEPLPTTDCRGAGYLVEPFLLSRQGEGAPRSVEDPTPTQVAKHSHVLISPYYGSGSGESSTTAEEPLPTITSKNRFGMVVPVTNSQGGPQPRSVEDPIPTITTAKGGEFAIVMPVTHAGGIDRALDPNSSPLPTVTGANRGELAFIAAQFGERDGQAPRVHDIDQPTPAVTATGHINLVEATPQYDILFRMLEPHELAAAMGFNTEDEAYEFAGTKTEKIKQIGNAVSVRMMQAEVKAIMADATPKSRKMPPLDSYSEAAE
jgi:DNA (cytosine-5)-methyltransferase 1